ncbi:MAG: hypothetical protein KIT84_08220 [Labilithrix sp.]|nr:hypothetical protein [Labilithrix sp.]MCW5810982.1 hypothetical protein [Labilithrix sp.]
MGTVLVACTALTGVGDLLVDPDAPDASEAAAPPPTTTGTGTSPPPPPPPEDGGLPLVDATVVDACSASGCEVLPDGFELVALGAPSSDADCPTGFAPLLDGVENPTLDPGACTCGCNLTQPPTCTVPAGGSITLLYGPVGSGSCTSTGQAVPTGCSTEGFHGPFIEYDRNYVAPTATRTGGNCTASASKDNSKLKTTSVRVCQATVIPQCDGKTCAPQVAPYETCVASQGARACPAEWPTRHRVGASASFTCGSGCTCSVEGQCSTSGTLRYFASTNCSGTAGLTYPVGGCNPTQAQATTYGSHRYDPNPPTNTSCKTGGTSAPGTPALAQELTVCCK